jgi:hypothetical protein
LVLVAGFEPAISCTQNKRLTKLGHTKIIKQFCNLLRLGICPTRVSFTSAQDTQFIVVCVTAQVAPTARLFY